MANRMSAEPVGDRRHRLTAVLCLLGSLLLTGCTTGLLGMPGAALFSERLSGKSAAEKQDDAKKGGKSLRRKKQEDNDFGSRVETPLLSEYIGMQGNGLVTLKGVGLVTGLNGQGGDPAPSGLRTQLQNEMARRGVKEANKILSSPDTAMVVVIAYLPTMVRKGQKFDVRVVLPPDARAKSLKGGWLLETRLFEEHTVDNQVSLRPQEYAVAGGAVLTGLGVEDVRGERQAELMAGTIPGGAISKVDRDLRIMLLSDKRGIRNAQRVAEAVSARFHKYNKYGEKIACAEAQTDSLVNLQAHAQYRNNIPRYQAVIRSIALKESDVSRRMRMESLARDVMDPERCQSAALQLEAIGEDAAPFLRDALESENFEVRFASAQSLAYLGDPAGVSVLKEAAKNQPAFRVYALVALSVIREDAEAIMALRELMSSGSLETRYGALRALKELDPRDPYLNPIEFENRFVVHVIDCEGEPMVHVTRRRMTEVTLFGSDQRLRLPAVLNAGDRLRIIGEAGDDSVDVIRYALDAEPERYRVPNRLADILRVLGELDASYPNVVQFLVEADSQHNLMGPFGIDRLPQAGRVFSRSSGESGGAESANDEAEAAAAAEADESAGKARRVGNPRLVPELFDTLDATEAADNETAEKLQSLDFSRVTEADKSRASSARQPKSRVLDEQTDAADDSESEATEAAVGAAEESADSAAGGDAEESAGGGEKAAASESEDRSAGDKAKTVAAEPPARPGFFSRFRRPFGHLTEPGAEAEQ
jgi:hypothetical protein